MPLPFDVKTTRRTLFEAMLDAGSRHGRRKVALEDPERNPLTYHRLTLGSLVLGRKLAGLTAQGEKVGVLMPNVQALAVVLFGLSAFGRVPAMLNFTAGLRNLSAACRAAQVTTVVTARRFVEGAKLDDVVQGLAESGLRIVWLEDVRASLGILDKIRGVIDSWRPRAIARAHGTDPDAPAVVLFTSGSEGHPKGVVLSHANLIANAGQIAGHGHAVFTARDVIFNPLPAFHSFGLTAGLLTGLLHGMKVVLYPSPLHYRQIPRLIRETGATILFSTDTFLQGYVRATEGDDLAGINYVVAGAERVKDETRRLWGKTGAVILEGYGATECAPVIACNLPNGNRPGTVGTILPDIRHRLEPVEGIHDAGRLVVSGPNVMLGYLRHDKPGVIEPVPDGWYDTGDIVSLDADGFVTIRGRARRFAKIGGEMVSLAAVETVIGQLWPDANHVVVALPDPRKGEQLVLVTEKPDADRDALLAYGKAQHLPELWMPRAILVVPAIPVMGSGKTDVMATVELAKANRALL